MSIGIHETDRSPISVSEGKVGLLFQQDSLPYNPHEPDFPETQYYC